jgi:hypothetical protein
MPGMRRGTILFFLFITLFLQAIYTFPLYQNVSCCSETRMIARGNFLKGDGILMMVHPQKAGGTSLCKLLTLTKDVHFGANINCNSYIRRHEFPKGDVECHYPPSIEPIMGVHWFPVRSNPEILQKALKRSGRNAFSV